MRVPYGAWWLAGNDLIDDLIFVDAYERGEWRFVQRFVGKGMTILDIGAHRGFYTLLVAQGVGASGRVIAFEPSPRERTRLKWNLRLNHLGRIVEVESRALSDRKGEATLYLELERANTGRNSLRLAGPRGEVDSVLVRTETLDGFLAEQRIQHVDFVKLDVEGAELSVLKGGKNLFGGISKPVVMVEVQDFTTAPWGYPAKAICELMVGWGYSWFSPTSTGNLRRSPMQMQYDTTNNLIAVPKELLPVLSQLICG